MRLTAGYAFSCYPRFSRPNGPRERVSFELDSAANK